MTVRVSKRDIVDAREKFPNIIDEKGIYTGASPAQETEIRQWIQVRRIHRSASNGAPQGPSDLKRDLYVGSNPQTSGPKSGS